MLHNIDQARNANARAGFHFFEPATIRFFGSRLPRKVYPVANGALFVTSEQRPTSYGETSVPARLYSVRFIHDDGAVETIGEFQGWSTGATANRFARDLAKVWTETTYLADVENEKNGRTVAVAVLGGRARGRDRVMAVAVNGGWRIFAVNETALIHVRRFTSETGEVAR